MGKSKELVTIIDEFTECGNGIVKAALEIAEFGKRLVKATADLKVLLSSDEETPKKIETVSVEELPKESAKPDNALSKEDVRQILADKSSANNGALKVEVRNLVKKYANGGSLGDVNPSDYAALIDEVEAIGNE